MPPRPRFWQSRRRHAVHGAPCDWGISFLLLYKTKLLLFKFPQFYTYILRILEYWTFGLQNLFIQTAEPFFLTYEPKNLQTKGPATRNDFVNDIVNDARAGAIFATLKAIVDDETSTIWWPLQGGTTTSITSTR